ncbi:MAG TPA: L-threonylcarbamoyladenylate synthase [Bacteroidota bacterium]|jgi:tRNA threonylcarbamoyl adenosine modification protein (Sua5/YciO/YrdC/YwlC family)
MILKVHPITPDQRLIGKAVDRLVAGGVIIYPTDTVYGIGCSIKDKSAIERVYLIKRQRNKSPFSFVCADLKNISEYAHVSNSAFKIIKRLIPGPYTFILPAARMKQLPKLLVSKRKTVGIRVPDNPITLALVCGLGGPILSTSVTTAEGDILNDVEEISSLFGNQVDIIIDGGAKTTEPSTVLDLTGDRPVVLRKGSGNLEAVRY